jgi:hypothetical protein
VFEAGPWSFGAGGEVVGGSHGAKLEKLLGVAAFLAPTQTHLLKALRQRLLKLKLIHRIQRGGG